MAMILLQSDVNANIHFIYTQYIQICNTLSCQFYDTLQFILFGMFITMLDDG